MNQISEILQKKREETGISLEEAANDLDYDIKELSDIESGNFKSFKDIFILKVIISDYAKYLGLDPEKIIDEFNDYVFESTSKIPIDEIQRASREKEKNSDDKIMSPYTAPDKKGNNLIKVLVTIMITLIIIAILILIHNSGVKGNDDTGLKVSYEVGDLNEE